MGFDDPQFPAVAETDRNTAAYHNDLLTKLGRIGRQTASNLGIPSPFRRGQLIALPQFLVMLRDHSCGSEGAATFTDARYAATRALPAYTLKSGDLAYGVEDKINRQCITAINLGELPKNPSSTRAGSHLLEAGQLVMVTGVIARTSPEQVFYFFDHAVPDPLDVDLTLNGGDDGNGDPGVGPLTYATYTYDVYYNGTLISDPDEPLSPTWARDIGPLNPATQGWARYVDGILVLRSCDERPKAQQCGSGGE